MKYTAILFICIGLAACRFPDKKQGDLVSDFIPADQGTDQYSNFTLCYQDLRHYDYVEKGLVGSIGKQKYYFETWFFPNIRNMALKFVFIRTDTTFIEDHDFCLQEIPLNENFEKDFALCYTRKGSRFVRDSTLTLDKIPGMLQPLVLYMNGWQNLRHMNRGEEDDPKLYIKSNNLYLEYFNYDAEDNKTAVKKVYPFDGKKFIVTAEPDPIPEGKEDTLK
ncbi:MAG: hypothetical protein WAT19_10650 [Ferruginibacter sp.]